MERFKPFRCRISGLLLAGNSLNLWNLSNLRIVSTSGSGFNHTGCFAGSDVVRVSWRPPGCYGTMSDEPVAATEELQPAIRRTILPASTSTSAVAERRALPRH
jgi:hypothetical protein